MLDLLLALSEEERLEPVRHVNEGLNLRFGVAVDARVLRERHSILRGIDAEVWVLTTLQSGRSAIRHGGLFLVMLS